MNHHDDLFGPIPSTVALREQPRSNRGVLVALLVGLLLTVVMGATYALFALRVGHIFSLANVAMGHVMGRVIRQRIGRQNASLAPVMAVAFTYVAGAMLFLPVVWHGLADWGQGEAMQRENLQWVRGHEQDAQGFDGVAGTALLLALTLKAPLLAAAAGVPVPLFFIGFGVAAAVRASLRE
jgi:hypothetical protein